MKGVPFVNKRHMQERGTFSVKYGTKGQGIGPRGKGSRIKFCSVSPWAYKFNRFWKGSVKGQCLTLLYFGLIFIQYCSTTAAF